MPRPSRPLLALCACSALSFAAGCGGASPAPVGDTFTYTASGVSPATLPVASGGCIVIRNGDTVNHDVAADDLTTCPELVGTTTLTPGHDWTWCGFQAGPKTCTFFDPTRTLAGGARDPAFVGAIQVRAP